MNVIVGMIHRERNNKNKTLLNANGVKLEITTRAWTMDSRWLMGLCAVGLKLPLKI
jgi:hypothetical protein